MTRKVKKLIQKKLVFDWRGTKDSGFEYHWNPNDDKSIDHLRPTRLKPPIYLINTNSTNRKIRVITATTESSIRNIDRKKYDNTGSNLIRKQIETGLKNDFFDWIPGTRESSWSGNALVCILQLWKFWIIHKKF